MSNTFIREHADIKRFLRRIPPELHETFTDEQLEAIKLALAHRGGGGHTVDLRGGLSLWRWKYYYVVLGGRERRRLTTQEKRLMLYANATLAAALLIVVVLASLLGLYIVKSALGINLFGDFSLGIWSDIKSTLQIR